MGYLDCTLCHWCFRYLVREDEYWECIEWGTGEYIGGTCSKADLCRVIESTGTLLLAFLIGSVGTTVGTVVAYLMVPMRSLGQDSWKIAAALMSRHIGGAVNYVAVSEALGVSPSVLAAGIAADNVICAIYFTTLFALASNILREAPSSANDNVVVWDLRQETSYPFCKLLLLFLYPLLFVQFPPI
ncbi:hypothetical protein MKX01_034075 [Papaver californicum]|nr:hypothetical protein MKX01_034075 [Papaver californicum]